MSEKIRVDVLHPNSMDDRFDSLVKRYHGEHYAGASQAFYSEKFGTLSCTDGYESCILLPPRYVGSFIKEAKKLLGKDCINNTKLRY